MKALIRNEGETVTETMGIEGIDWTTGAPLTNPVWAGGRYTLVQNYVEPQDPEEEPVYEIVEDMGEENVTVTDDTVIIDGKEYTKKELRQLLGE